MEWSDMVTSEIIQSIILKGEKNESRTTSN
jgi:hypothetical protein